MEIQGGKTRQVNEFNLTDVQFLDNKDREPVGSAVDAAAATADLPF